MDYDRDGTVSWAELTNWLAFDDNALRALALKLRMAVAKAVATGNLDVTTFSSRMEAERDRQAEKREGRHTAATARGVRAVVAAATGLTVPRHDASMLLAFLSADAAQEATGTPAGAPPPLARAASAGHSRPDSGSGQSPTEETVCAFLRAHLLDCFEAEASDVS